eukprot:9423452-Lingulodinium_polyedra.AAC.1
MGFPGEGPVGFSGADIRRYLRRGASRPEEEDLPVQQAAGGRQAAQDWHEVQQFCASGPAGGGSTEG